MSLSFVSHCYQLDDLEPIKINDVDSSEIPSDYLNLLSHTSYMTQTLSDHMQNRLQLHRIHQIIVDNRLFRVIKLQTTQDVPVMLAFIEIVLPTLPSQLADAVIAGKEPLGRLLLDNDIPPNLSCESLHHIESDAFLAKELLLDEGMMLYGRNSLVKNQHNVLIANSFEVLSPMVLMDTHKACSY